MNIQNLVQQSIQASKEAREYIKQHACEKCTFILDEVVLCERCAEKQAKELSK